MEEKAVHAVFEEGPVREAGQEAEGKDGSAARR